MSSKPPIGKRTTSVEVKTAIVPRIPQDTINEILDHLVADSDFGSLRASALVSKSWIPSCRKHLFYNVDFTSKNMNRWLKTFPIPDQSPARYVRNLRLWIRRIPRGLFKHSAYLKNVRRMFLVGWGKVLGFQLPSLWVLPQSVTSLTIDTGAVTLVEIRDIMVRLPNLDDLSLPGPLFPMDRREVRGIGKALRGRFRGKLVLHNIRSTNMDVVSTLLEIPTGLHFTEVEIQCARECLPPVVKLVEACCKTIVKLSHTVNTYDVGRDREPIERSFNFSKFPNLQAVHFGLSVDWMGRGVPWIPMALSTISPTTSPRLSSLRLDFVGSPYSRTVGSLIRDVGDDLLRIADEVARIKREFEGAVYVTVVRDPTFEVVLGRSNIPQHTGR